MERAARRECRSAKSVSYTHLDVYKRQVLCSNVDSVLIVQALGAGEVLLDRVARSLVLALDCDAEPVVDVYKRQVEGDRSTGPPLRAAICSGDSPRRRQSLIASSLAAAAGSSASIPRLEETRTESAHSCAARAS